MRGAGRFVAPRGRPETRGTEMTNLSPPSRVSCLVSRVSFLVVAAATLALMIATEPRLAIVWDEGYTLGREVRIRMWLRALRDPARFAATWEPPALELVQQD